MALKIFKNKGESGAIPLSAENLNYNFQEVLNMVCPVGKVEIFFDNGDHSNYLGFTWERTGTGKAIVGIDSSDTDFSTIGKTGGEKKHTLTVYELPTKIPVNYGNISGGTDIVISSSVVGTGGVKDGQANMNISSTGQAHNNLQPYQVFAIWKRTA